MSANIKKISIAPFMIGLLALVLGGCATTTTNQPGVTKAQVQAAKDREKIRALQTYRKRLQRVHDVAFPLLAASAGLTDKNKTWSYGILFESLVDYRKRDRKFAKRAFPELTDTLTISHVIKGSPAETSGLMVGDVLEEYNGKKITKPNDLENAFKPLRSKERPGPGRFVVAPLQCCIHQGGPAKFASRVDVGSLVDQGLHRLGLAFLRRLHKGRFRERRPATHGRDREGGKKCEQHRRNGGH